MVKLQNYTVAKAGTEFKAYKTKPEVFRDVSKDGLILDMYNKIKEQEQQIAFINDRLAFYVENDKLRAQ